MAIGGTFDLKIGTIHPAASCEDSGRRGESLHELPALPLPGGPIQRSRRVTKTEHRISRFKGSNVVSH